MKNIKSRLFGDYTTHDIMPRMLPDLQLGDAVRLRKPHPCGGYEWRIIRMGADIGLECISCGRRILLPRRVLARRLKAILPETGDQPLAG